MLPQLQRGQMVLGEYDGNMLNHPGGQDHGRDLPRQGLLHLECRARQDSLIALTMGCHERDDLEAHPRPGAFRLNLMIVPMQGPHMAAEAQCHPWVQLGLETAWEAMGAPMLASPRCPPLPAQS